MFDNYIFKNCIFLLFFEIEIKIKFLKKYLTIISRKFYITIVHYLCSLKFLNKNDFSKQWDLSVERSNRLSPVKGD
jgi:hypothetical protein